MHSKNEVNNNSSKEILEKLLNLKLDASLLPYPQKANRYFPMGINSESQKCYTQSDIHLLHKFKKEFGELISKERVDKYFADITEKHWMGLWKCTQPAENVPTLDTFTIPNREVKDGNMYPLWTFADNMARQIANWQSKRTTGQNKLLLNDPVMAVFDLLRDEFYETIAMQECKPESITYLRQLQTIVRRVMYWAPNYGPDRFYLHRIQESLQEATVILENCISNKELPTLLRDTINNGKSLEFNVGTHLHFLVDQSVSDNFSTEYLGGDCTDRDSPVCKLFMYAKQSSADNGFSQINRFYNYKEIINEDGVRSMKMDLRLDLLDGIKFNGAIDKEKYLETIALLESLINVRHTLEKFQHVQAKLGNYAFAVKFMDAAKNLAGNYINLIIRVRDSLTDLTHSADKGLQEIIRQSAKTKTHFEKNLEALQTNAIKNTNLHALSLNAIKSINGYQNAMEHLVSAMQSGEASREIELEMTKLTVQMAELNRVIPALLNDHDIELQHIELPSSIPTSQPTQAHTKTKTVEYGFWDEQPVMDPIKNKPIFTYRVFTDADKTTELGSVSFYNVPMLCVSEDQKQHNIVKATGIFQHFQLDESMTVNTICEVMPPTLFERVYYAAQGGLINGALSGAANVIGYTLKSMGTSEKVANVLRTATYYGGIFSLNFYSYYRMMDDYDQMTRVSNALFQSLLETSFLGAVNISMSFVSHLLQKINGDWGLQYLTQAGYFIYRGIKGGFFEAATGTAAAMLTEKAIEHAAGLR